MAPGTDARWMRLDECNLFARKVFIRVFNARLSHNMDFDVMEDSGPEGSVIALRV